MPAILPYLNAALICERVIEEKEGTLSAFRIIDRIEVEYPTELQEKKITPVIQIDGLVTVRSGEFKGQCKVSVAAQMPSGKRSDIFAHNFELKGGDHGHNIRARLTLGANEEGLHWFDVSIQDQLVSRIPLMLVRKEPVKLGGTEQAA